MLNQCINKTKIYFLLSLIVTFPFLLKGQEELKFNHITLTKGLSQSSIKSICQDFRGYMWFGTADGLNKYNGFEIVKYYYTPGDSTSITSSDITCLYENPYDSILYIGTKNAGISVYNRDYNNFIPFERLLKPEQRKSLSNIVGFYAIDKNYLWIVSNGKGIFLFNKKDSTLYSPEFNEKRVFKTVTDIVFDSDKTKNMWITTTYGLYYWNTDDKDKDPVRITLAGTGKRIHITSLESDSKGRIYIGTWNNGLLRYNPHTGNTVSVFFSKNKYTEKPLKINDVLISKNSNIWVGTTFGLYKVKKDTVQSFINDYLNPYSINDNHVISLYESKSGIIWIGTLLGGVNELDPKTALFPKYHNFFSGSQNVSGYYTGYNNIFGIKTDDKKHVWINTSGGLLEIKPLYFKTRKSEGNVIRHISNHLYGDIFIDNRLGIFYSVANSIILMHKNGKKEKLTPKIRRQTGGNITYFTSGLTDSDGMIWFSTAFGMLKYDIDKNKFELFTVKNSSKGVNIIINEIKENSKGKILITTNNGVLIEFDKYTGLSKTIFPFDNDEDGGNKFSSIFSVLEYEPGKLYTGTNSGLYFIDIEKQQYKHFLKINGKSINVIYGLLKDKKGELWCTTNNGVLVYEPKSGIFQHFTYYEGLQSNEFNQASYHKDKNGIFYIGGIDGLNVFNPDDIHPDNLIPTPIIEKFEILYDPVTPSTHPEILKKQISETSKLELSYKQSTFSFEYIALCYSQPDRINYKYMLEGFDNKWVEAGNRRSATYTNVPPGDYIFKVLNTNTNGLWRKDPLAVRLVIPAPFWQTIWFRLLIIFTIISTGLLIFYLKIQSIKKQKLLLTKTINEKTEELYEQKLKIEQQNKELLSRNQIITEKNKNLNTQHMQIKQQHDELVKLTKKLKETNKAKLQFFTAISHEFRTPLTLIISPLQDIIKNTDRFNKVQLIRHLNTVYSNASKLLLLMNQLLDFRKVESGNEKLIISNIEIVSFAKKILLLYNDLALKNNIKTGLRASAPSIEITSDSLKLEKIITNLISNAFRNTPANGEISLDIRMIKNDKGEKCVQVTVADSGYGVNKETINKIFDHDDREESEYISHGGGLGLILVRRYIEALEGKIRVESTLGDGARFIFTIPAEKHVPNAVQEEQAIKHMWDNSQQVVASLQSYFPINMNNVETSDDRGKQTILLIEYDKDLKHYLKDTLSGYYRVITADTTEKGFQIATSKNPDLIITDVKADEEDGFKFCSRVKSHFNTSHIPIIIISALTEHENIVNGLSAGANDYITKPFELEFLLIKINNLLNLRNKLQTKIIHDTQLTDHEFTNKKDKQFLDKVIECIENNISDSTYSVDQLCDCVGVSHPQVYRKIKAMTNMSISVFIRNIRLKKAATLLLSGDMKINEVAYEVGFSDPNYFTKCFTKLYEQTPREYVKNAQE